MFDRYVVELEKSKELLRDECDSKPGFYREMKTLAP